MGSNPIIKGVLLVICCPQPQLKKPVRCELSPTFEFLDHSDTILEFEIGSRAVQCVMGREPMVVFKWLA